MTADDPQQTPGMTADDTKRSPAASRGPSADRPCLTGEQIRALDRAHVVHSWSTQSQISPSVVSGGEGRYFWGPEGRRILDFASLVVNANLGHQHPRVTEAIASQARRLCVTAPAMTDEARARLAALLAEITPGDLTMSFFTNGGADATENAIKLARWYTGRQKIVARYRSYHGATAGAASVTGDPRRWAAEPGVPGVVRMFDPYPYRCPAGHDHPQVYAPGRGETTTGRSTTVSKSAATAFDDDTVALLPARDPGACPVCSGGPHLEEILQYEGPHTVAAVILETVTGTNGVLVPPDGYLASIREVCDRYDILLILDEVMSGFGRTGRWFACEHWDVVPDIMTVAKGITSGYLPLGAVIVSERLADWLQDHEFAAGLTSTGNPLCCAAGIATIEAMREEKVVENAAAMGEVLAAELPRLAAEHPCVGEARGLGLLWALELVKDRTTREPLVPFNAKGEAAGPMRRLFEAALARGLYLMTHFNLVLVAPPLTITRAELDEGLTILDEVLAVGDEALACRARNGRAPFA
ncbi:MAG TPA: aminotransferase class III-fold pyridoxal phosphate-dependent enzyme [Thermoleophilia bacterium]|nr:aminotransferase class III-fold pyridoxal phosphate-dependent enzyme [Thermoleophilia bacterium]